jgi:iron(III) transport system permease protein
MMHPQSRARLGRGLLWLPFLLLTCGPVACLLAKALFPAGQGLAGALAPLQRLVATFDARVLWNSVELGLLVVVATAAVGVPYGFLVRRTDLKWRGLFELLAITPLLLPPYMEGLAWVQVMPLHGRSACVFILSSVLFPVTVLLSARSFSEVGRDGEDAARLSFGEWGALRRVTLPLAAPGIGAAALLTFVFAVSDFVVTDFFSFAGKGDTTFQVGATKAYGEFARQQDPVAATTTVIPLVLVALLGLLLLARLESTRERTSLSGSHAEPRPFRLGRAQPLAHLFLVSLLGISIGVPVFELGLLAAKRHAAPPTAPTNPNAQLALGTVDLTAYQSEDPVRVAMRRHVPDLLNSVKIAAGATLLLLACAFGPARALSRARRVPFAQRALVLLPLAFPGLMVGMGVQQLFVNSPNRVYEGWGLVALALASRFLPVAVLALRASWIRLAPEIEESAALFVAGSARRFGRVALPLLLPGALAAGALCFTLSLREFDSIVLLFGAQSMLTVRIYNLVHWAQDAVVGSLCLLQMAAIFVLWATARLLIGARGR